MIINLIANETIKDVVCLLKTNPTFFDLTKTKKTKIIQSELDKFYPQTIMGYITEIHGVEALRKDLLGIAELTKSKLIDAIADFIIDDLSKILDGEKSEQLINKNSKSFLIKTIYGLIQLYDHAELEYLASNDLKTVKDSPTIVVQTPINLSTKTRQNIRDKFVKKYDYAFPEFRISKDLLGGIKILEDGKLSDFSWKTQIDKLDLIKITTYKE